MNLNKICKKNSANVDGDSANEGGQCTNIVTVLKLVFKVLLGFSGWLLGSRSRGHIYFYSAIFHWRNPVILIGIHTIVNYMQDFSTGSNWSCVFATLTNRNLLSLKVIFMWAVLTSLHC